MPTSWAGLNAAHTYSWLLGLCFYGMPRNSTLSMVNVR